MNFIEWIDEFMDEEEKVHFLDAGLMKSAWNAAIDEAVKDVLDYEFPRDLMDANDFLEVIANKLKELKE